VKTAEDEGHDDDNCEDGRMVARALFSDENEDRQKCG
jgi:hypothetical protein